MSPFAPFTEEQFQYLAMGKARAWTWETLAQQLDMPIEIVERVAWTHEKLWNRALTKAERYVARETISEVAVILRKDIRNNEPQLHATLTNSLSRVLKLQQEFAPPRRQKLAPVAPAIVPTPVVPTLSPSAPTPSVGPSFGTTVASLLGFFVLLAALLTGCWRHGQRSDERSDFVRCEPVAALVLADERPGHEEALAPCVVLTPPPWVREPCINRHDGT